MKYSTVVAEMQIADGVKEGEVSSLYERMQKVTDGCGKRGRGYGAALVLTLIIVANLAGETKLRGIAAWAWCRREELATQLPRRQGKNARRQ